MIVRGTAEELRLNREGQLAPSQRERLGQLPIFRLPYWPSLILALVFGVIGLLRGGAWVWVGLGIAVLLLITGLSRLRQQRRLQQGQVESLEGRIKQVRATPLRAFESLLTIDGSQAVLLAGTPGEPLQPGGHYRLYLIRGLASLPIVLAVEMLD
ncbi:MAG: hypothetical protein KatS3mg057_2523 [Herpetosiphonaceae bacterium]|nr:MAG: hypothetical protein KatS3mg057_2523 [Herpetosiphonaceae bacterium]